MMLNLHPSVFFAKKKGYTALRLDGDPPGPRILRDCRRRRGEYPPEQRKTVSNLSTDFAGDRRDRLSTQRCEMIFGVGSLIIDGKQQNLIKERFGDDYGTFEGEEVRQIRRPMERERVRMRERGAHGHRGPMTNF